MDLRRIKKLNEEMRTLLHEISPELKQKVVDTRKANYLAAQATADRLKARYDRTSNLAKNSNKIKGLVRRKAVEDLVDTLESTSSNIFGKNIKDSIFYTENGCYILPNNDFFEDKDKLVPNAEEQLKQLLEEMSKKYRVKYSYKVNGYRIEIYIQKEFPKGSFAEWYGEDLTGRTYDGDIRCWRRNLTSLKGCPEVVQGYFACNDNNLTSLEGCPEEIHGDFHCSYNNLTSLKGAPKLVTGDFYCGNNKLTSLEGCPQELDGDLICDHNNLTNLKGCPEKVGGDFYCHANNLTSLEGAPEIVEGDFDCMYNNLENLEGAPKVVKGYFHCDDYLKEEAEQMGYTLDYRKLRDLIN